MLEPIREESIIKIDEQGNETLVIPNLLEYTIDKINYDKERKKEKLKQYNKQYYLDHKNQRKQRYEMTKDKQKEYYINNKEKILKRLKESYSNDREKYINRVRARQSKEKLIKSNTIPIETIIETKKINFIDDNKVIYTLDECELILKFIKV